MFEAKKISKMGMMLGALIIMGYNFGYLLFTHKIPTMAEQKSILLFGFAIIAVFSPIYLSVIMDKFVEMFKKGGE